MAPASRTRQYDQLAGHTRADDACQRIHPEPADDARQQQADNHEDRCEDHRGRAALNQRPPLTTRRPQSPDLALCACRDMGAAFWSVTAGPRLQFHERNAPGMRIKALDAGLLVAALATPAVRVQYLAVSAQYDTTHVYLAPTDVQRFAQSFVATFGGKSTPQAIVTVTPTPSETSSQLLAALSGATP